MLFAKNEKRKEGKKRIKETKCGFCALQETASFE
jgi:hypothetical protein